MIKPDFKDRLKEQADIVTLINELVPLKKSGVNWRGCCPFHDEKSPSFYVNPNRQTYKCFGCGESGDIYRFVMTHSNLSFSEAVHYVAGRCNQVVEYEQTDRPVSRLKGLRL